MVTQSTSFCRYQLSRKFKRPIPQLQLNPMSSYCEQDFMLEDIRRSLLNPQCGIHILCAPSGCGKTTTALRALENLRAEGKILGGVRVSWRDILETNRNLTLLARLKSSLEISPLESSTNLNALLPPAPLDVHRPVVLLIDQFDHARCDDDMKSFLISLAEESVLTKRYTVLLCTGSLAKSRSIHDWNGKTKLHQVNYLISRYRWSDADIKTLVCRLGGLDAFEDQATRQKVLEAFCIVGTPGFVLDHIWSTPAAVPYIIRDAEVKKAEWDVDSAT